MLPTTTSTSSTKNRQSKTTLKMSLMGPCIATLGKAAQEGGWVSWTVCWTAGGRAFASWPANMQMKVCICTNHSGHSARSQGKSTWSLWCTSGLWSGGNSCRERAIGLLCRFPPRCLSSIQDDSYWYKCHLMGDLMENPFAQSSQSSEGESSGCQLEN